jgi:hypothetical protein
MFRIVAYILAAALGVLGLIFIAGAQGQVLRIVIGVILILGAGGLIALSRLAPVHTTITQKIDLSGDVNVQDLVCRRCGGHLSQKSVSVRAGAVFVNCEYCGAAYQLEEQPKW